MRVFAEDADMIAHPQDFMSAEDYLDWEQEQEIRHEYLDGELVAMTGGTVPHNDIAINLLMLLRPQVRSRGCRLNMADVKVQVTPTVYFYPDLVVSCDHRDRTAIKLIQFPKLIIEVLSPGTEGSDRGRKFTLYRTLATLQEYVLVDSTQISVECFRRDKGRQWLYVPYTTGEVFTLESVEFSCPIDQLYEEVLLQ